jgi:hypothetical protein
MGHVHIMKRQTCHVPVSDRGRCWHCVKVWKGWRGPCTLHPTQCNPSDLRGGYRVGAHTHTHTPQCKLPVCRGCTPRACVLTAKLCCARAGNSSCCACRACAPWSGTLSRAFRTASTWRTKVGMGKGAAGGGGKRSGGGLRGHLDPVFAAGEARGMVNSAPLS